MHSIDQRDVVSDLTALVGALSASTTRSDLTPEPVWTGHGDLLRDLTLRSV